MASVPLLVKKAFAGFSPGKIDAQLLGQLHDGDGGEERRDVLERADLLLDGRHHAGLAVAEADRHDPAEEVQVLPALGVEEPLPLAAHEGQRLLVVGAEAVKVAPVLLDDLLGRSRLGNSTVTSGRAVSPPHSTRLV